MSTVEHIPLPEPPPRGSPVSRRIFTAGLVGTAALVPLSSPVRASGQDTSRQRWARRAERSYEALQTYFAASHGLYREQYPVDTADRAYSFEWPFSQAHVAALDLTGMAGIGRRYRDALAAHRQAQRHYWSSAGSTGLPGFCVVRDAAVQGTVVTSSTTTTSGSHWLTCSTTRCTTTRASVRRGESGPFRPRRVGLGQ